jgi:hypothetical protein
MALLTSEVPILAQQAENPVLLAQEQERRDVSSANRRLRLAGGTFQDNFRVVLSNPDSSSEGRFILTKTSVTFFAEDPSQPSEVFPKSTRTIQLRRF